MLVAVIWLGVIGGGGTQMAAFIAIAITAIWMAVGLGYFALNSRSKESRIFPFPGRESKEDKHRNTAYTGVNLLENNFEEHQISIFFEIQAKSVQSLPEIVNKSQPTLYNTANMTNGSRKEPQKCNTLEKSFSSLINKTKFTSWLSFSAISDSKEKLIMSRFLASVNIFAESTQMDNVLAALSKLNRH